MLWCSNYARISLFFSEICNNLYKGHLVLILLGSSMLSETLYNYFVAETHKFAKSMKIHELKWNRDSGRQLIMDVGCGINRISTDFLSQRYVNADKIYIDNNPEVIRYFSRKKESNLIKYQETDILDWGHLEKMEGSLSKVVSLR
ncbi:hypothetical protein AVEN_149788-1, partial [Araneus ventricosus]